MPGKLIGYARVSTDAQDLTAQTNALTELGVPADRIYLDKGRSGTNRDRPGLREALAACWEGDTLVVTKLDRLARSAGDARDISEELAGKGARLSFNGSTHDPADPMGRMVFGMLSVFAEFESDLIRARTKEGMKIAKAKGRLKGGKPKLRPTQEAHLVALYRSGDHTVSELCDLFSIGRATVYRAIRRADEKGAVTVAVALPRVDS
jgi:DNA invertase Pin-like site-specific DNA recombinase